MRKWIAAAMLAAIPGIAQAATVNSSLIPDGTYIAHVDSVTDAKDMMVTLNNGLKTSLSTNRDSITFDKFAANDTVKVSLVKGIVVAAAKE